MRNRQLPCILLVEDSLTDVKLLQRWLKLSGIEHELRVFSDGEAAFEYLAHANFSDDDHCPDLILLDENLPGTTGVELALVVKRRDESRDVPVVVFLDPTLPQAERLNNLPRCHCRRKPQDADEYQALVDALGTMLHSS